MISASVYSNSLQAANASRAKTAGPFMGRKSRVAGEQRVKNIPHGEKYSKSKTFV